MGAFEILCAGGEEASSHLEDKLADWRVRTTDGCWRECWSLTP